MGWNQWVLPVWTTSGEESSFHIQSYTVVRIGSSTDNGEQARGEAGDQVFASASTDDGVVSTGDGGPVVSRHHQTHLDELAGIAW